MALITKACHVICGVFLHFQRKAFCMIRGLDWVLAKLDTDVFEIDTTLTSKGYHWNSKS